MIVHAAGDPPPRRASGQRRQLLLQTALTLFAERGIDGVSLREIGTAAKQGNTAAVHYFFKDKDGLLLAILQHIDELAPHRWDIAAELLSSSREPRLEELAAAIVQPFVTIYQADPHAASFMAKLMVNSRRDAVLAEFDRSGPFLGVTKQLARHLDHLPPRVARQRVQLGLLLVIHAVADHADTQGSMMTAWANPQRIADELTDAVIGVLVAPARGSAGPPSA